MSTIRVQALPKFPADVEAGDGITITRSGGVFTFAVDTGIIPALDPDLLAIAGLTSAADKGIQFTGPGTAGTFDLTPFAKTILDDANAGAALSTLGVSSFGKTLIDDADAAAALTTLGVSAFAKTILDDANAGVVRATIGAAASGANGDITGLSGLAAVSSAVSFTNATAATSSSTGAIKATGGVSSQGAGVFGGGVAVTGALGSGPIAANVMALDHQGFGNARFITYGSGTGTPGKFTFHQSSSNNSVFRDVFTCETDGGVVVGPAAGGSKGAGSINLAADIYKNNTAYNNPDYVLEHYFNYGAIVRFAGNAGAARYPGIHPLDGLKDRLKSTLRLPGVSDDPAGMFERSDIALEKIEEAHLYIVELHERVAKLEARQVNPKH